MSNKKTITQMMNTDKLLKGNKKAQQTFEKLIRRDDCISVMNELNTVQISSTPDGGVLRETVNPILSSNEIDKLCLDIQSIGIDSVGGNNMAYKKRAWKRRRVKRTPRRGRDNK